MMNVQLQFDSLQNLWRFKEKTQLQNFEIQTGEHILFCTLSDEAVQLAINQFGAIRMEQPHKTH